MPPTPRVQPLFTDNHQDRVLTLTLYLARLQDHHWTLADREPSLMYNTILCLQYSPSAADELKKKKKKRKREGGDSDIEQGVYQNLAVILHFCISYLSVSEAQRPRKLSPPVQSHVQPPKAQKSTVSTNVPHKVSLSSFLTLPPFIMLTRRSSVILQTLNGPDFSIPPAQQLLPPRPPIPPPPIAGPSKPSEVMEDFSKVKQPSQTPITTFYSSVEPFMRNIKEEDVGFLEYTGDEVEPYVMPKLGRHYLEVWEDQDAGLLPPVMLGESPVAPPSAFAAPTPKWDSSTLTEADLLTEEKGHGPLTERVISALLPIPDLTVWKGVKAAEDAMEGRPGGSGAAAARRERLNVTDLEGRIRDTMRYHGLLNFVVSLTPSLVIVSRH